MSDFDLKKLENDLIEQYKQNLVQEAETIQLYSRLVAESLKPLSLNLNINKQNQLNESIKIFLNSFIDVYKTSNKWIIYPKTENDLEHFNEMYERKNRAFADSFYHFMGTFLTLLSDTVELPKEVSKKRDISVEKFLNHDFSSSDLFKQSQNSLRWLYHFRSNINHFNQTTKWDTWHSLNCMIIYRKSGINGSIQTLTDAFIHIESIIKKRFKNFEIPINWSDPNLSQFVWGDKLSDVFIPPSPYSCFGNLILYCNELNKVLYKPINI